MRRKILHILLVVLIVFVQIGCSSLEGRYINNDVPNEIEKASGVSYYLTQPTFEIQRKTTQNSKKAEPVYELVISATPDPKRRFEVGMSQGWFSSDTFELKLAEDARVKSITGSSADQTARVIASLGVLAAEVAGAVGTGGLTAQTAPHEMNALIRIFKDGYVNRLIDLAERDNATCYIGNIACTRTPPSHEDYIKIAKKLKTNLIETVTTSFKGIEFQVERLEKIDPTGIPSSSKERFDFFSEEEQRRIVKNYAEYMKEEEKFSKANKKLLSENDLKEELKKIDKKYEELLKTDEIIETYVDSLTEVEKKVLKIYDSIEKVGESIVKAAGESPPAPAVAIAKAISNLKKELDEAIAEAVKDPGDNDKVKAMKSKATKFKVTVSLVLQADELVNKRGLSARRDILTDFLKAPIARGASGNISKGYLDFASQLDKVMVAINSLIGSTTASSKSLPLATEITSRVTRNVFVYRWNKELGNEELNNKIQLAKARVSYGESNAAIITFPSAH